MAGAMLPPWSMLARYMPCSAGASSAAAESWCMACSMRPPKERCIVIRRVWAGACMQAAPPQTTLTLTLTLMLTLRLIPSSSSHHTHPQAMHPPSSASSPAWPATSVPHGPWRGAWLADFMSRLARQGVASSEQVPLRLGGGVNVDTAEEDGDSADSGDSGDSDGDGRRSALGRTGSSSKSSKASGSSTPSTPVSTSAPVGVASTAPGHPPTWLIFSVVLHPYLAHADTHAFFTQTAALNIRYCCLHGCEYLAVARAGALLDEQEARWAAADERAGAWFKVLVLRALLRRGGFHAYMWMDGDAGLVDHSMDMRVVMGAEWMRPGNTSIWCSGDIVGDARPFNTGVCIARGDPSSRPHLLALMDAWWALPDTVPSLERLKRETPWEQKAIHMALRMSARAPLGGLGALLSVLPPCWLADVPFSITERPLVAHMVCSSALKREQRATYYGFWHAVYAQAEEAARQAAVWAARLAAKARKVQRQQS